MAKVSERSSKNSANKATTKANNNTTPSIMNGKVQKVRVNVKNLKLQTKTKSNSKENIDPTNSPKQVAPKMRLFCVKLKRTHINNSGSNNNNNTLQAQCKVNANDVIEDTHKENRERSSPNKINVDTNLGKDLGANETSCTVRKDIEECNNNNIASSNEIKNNKKVSRRVGAEKCVGLNQAESNVEKLNGKVEGTSSINKIINRRCVVNVKRIAQKTPTKTKAKHGVNGGSPLMTPNTNKTLRRRCVVKLKRTPQLNTRSKDQQVKNLIPSTPRNTKRCLVRVQRTPVMKKTQRAEPTKSAVDVIDLTANDSQLVVPALDQNKRNNFRKLSLNQSLNQKSLYVNQKANKITKPLDDKTVEDSLSKIDKETNAIGDKNNPKTLKSTINNKENDRREQISSTQHNNVPNLKRVQKLSLRKPSIQHNKTKSAINLETTQFEMQPNSTINFEPIRNSTLNLESARNSTLLEFGFTKDKNKENQVEINVNDQNNNDQEKENDTTTTENKSTSQNLANKSQEIENLLNSLDDEDEQAASNEENNQAKEGQIEMSLISNKPNKFFHRHENNTTKNNLKQVDEVEAAVEKKSSPQRKGILKKRRHFSTKRSSLPKRDNVYEFLSQSQTSDSDSNKHLDPAADIIKRLIEQGRVRVATNCKGKGRPKLKKPPKKQVKRVKQTAATKKDKQLTSKPQPKNNKKQKNIEIEDHDDDDNHFMDDFDHCEPLPADDNDIEPLQPQEQAVKRLTNQNHHISDQEGTFSSLARSVLIHQAGRSDMQRQKAKRLLEMAKKFVSTPKNKKTPLAYAALQSDLSPIAMPPPRPAGKASPWRVDEDAHLPRIFNFSRSSGNLPSFSSDFIPPTPRKLSPKNNAIQEQESSLPEIDQINSILTSPHQSPLRQAIEVTPPPNGHSAISSFSSNDSNGENMPPPSAVTTSGNNENNNIFDLKQLPNPRRTLKNRSPLKAINILEVVHLPPYKPPAAKDTESDNISLFGFEENLDNDPDRVENISASTTPQKSPVKKSKKPAAQQEELFGFEDFLTQTDFSSQECCDSDVFTAPHKSPVKKTKKRTTQQEELFGFEDFLTQTDSSSPENCDLDVQNTENINKTIHDKLQDLRKLRPEENDLQLSVAKEKTKSPIKTLGIFNDNAAAGSGAIDVDGMRQRGIKEMLCSTMIDSPQPSTSKQALAQLKKRNLQNLQKANFGEESNLSELFKDPEPETTFNENDAHRTYIRPFKRKRRLNENKVVMFLDSDESGDEHDSAEHRKHHNSRETDTSSEKTPKKKRQRKEPKQKAELTEFIHDFNEMCKDVEDYELIVEKSA